MIGELHGRLTRTPELKTGTRQDGTAWSIASFSIAVDNRYPRDDASFYECYVSGKRAEALVKYFNKGSEIVVRGDLRQEPYTKDGKTVRPFKFAVDDFDFCGKKDGATPAQSEPTPDGFEQIAEDCPF